MKTVNCPLSLFLAILLCCSLLTGCGKTEAPFQVMFAGPFVNEELAAAYGENIAVEGDIQYSGFSFGSESVDPMAYGAGAMMMSAMVAAGEVDVLICDLEEAARYARGESFLDLRSVFTEEELAPYADRLLTFEEIDAYGNHTGAQTVPCGLDLSGREVIDYILGGGSYGIFLVCTTGDLELAKAVFWEIVNS